MSIQRDIGVFISLLLLSLALIGATWVLVRRLSPEHRRSHQARWLLSWSVKSLILPVLLWWLLNWGLSWSLQPFMPEVQFARNNGGNWFATFLGVFGEGLFIVSSYWTTTTLAWVTVREAAGLKGEERSDFKSLCLTCILGLFLPAFLILFLGGWPALGFAGAVIAIPLAGYTPNILRRKKMPPMYSRAVARMKFGKYDEAEWEILRELEKYEDDFEGWMMLAELYARHFHDLSEAEQTVLEVCDHPKTTPPQLSIALHRLSQWHLDFAQNPDAARRALQIICDRLPGTHLAHMAQLRINQIPHTQEELLEQKANKPIPLPEPDDVLVNFIPTPELELDMEGAVTSANACVEQLNADPNDVVAREKLAHLLAERLNKAPEAIDQLTLLLNLPDSSESKRAEWLSLAATWHIRYLQDNETARKLYQRIIREFPQSTEAAFARRRLQDLDLEYHG